MDATASAGPFQGPRAGLRPAIAGFFCVRHTFLPPPYDRRMPGRRRHVPAKWQARPPRIQNGQHAPAGTGGLTIAGILANRNRAIVPRGFRRVFGPGSKRGRVQLPEQPGTDRRLIGCFAQLYLTPF
jgi:hypothetical protein